MVTKKRSNLISFKVSEAVQDQLERLRGEDEESLSLVAKRLLEEAVGEAEPQSSVDAKLDKILLSLESPIPFISMEIIKAELREMNRFDEEDLLLIAWADRIRIDNFFEGEEFQLLKNDILTSIIERVLKGQPGQPGQFG